MWGNIACEALGKKKCLQLSYDGFSRLVEVHAVGVTKEGNGIMRVFQVAGGSNGGQPVGWKLLRLDEAFSASISNEPSQAPRPGYARGDKAMLHITCQI
jgi:hypothetical protein